MVAAPTLLFNIRHGFSGRYLLQTDVLPELLERGARVVILVPADGPYLDPFRSLPGVAVEVVPPAPAEASFNRSAFQGVARQIRFFTYGRRVESGDVLWRLFSQERRDGASAWSLRGLAVRLRLLFYRVAVLVLRRSRWLREALLDFEEKRASPPVYDEVLDKHRPGAVVVLGLGTANYDQYLMRAAKRLGIPSVSVVESFDNTTTHGYRGARADHVVTWTETMKEEAISCHDQPEPGIFVGGVAHFDAYHRPDPGYQRDQLLRSLGADPSKRMIFVATRSPTSYPWNPNIVELLGQAAKSGSLPDVQVVVRIHPLHYKHDASGRLVYAEALAAYERIRVACPQQVLLNLPRFTSSELEFAMPQEEITLLTRLLRASDVVVTVFSTVNIEASILDKPIVNVCFERLANHYAVVDRARFDIRADSQMDHNARILATGGVATVMTPQDLVAQVKLALDDPSHNAAGRRLIVEREAGPRHGDAGRAIATHLYEIASGSAAR